MICLIEGLIGCPNITLSLPHVILLLSPLKCNMKKRCLFIDMNSFFASVEQQDRPELRGRPVIVAPVMAETTCAIAASYEAKALGIKTGTSVRAARRLCPNLVVAQARPERYVEVHEKIVETLNRHFVTVNPLSVDEMACWVGSLDRGGEKETALAGRVKADMDRMLGGFMKSSIGIAPNIFLAKVASDMEKPNGLTVFDVGTYQERLFQLNLKDLPGIADSMEARLGRNRIRTVRELWDASPELLHAAWGSRVGIHWWHMLRGDTDLDYGANQSSDTKKTVGHSHVLPPDLKTIAGAKSVLIRLFTKALKRLRTYDQVAGGLEMWVKFRHRDTYLSWSWGRKSKKHLHANDDLTWIRIARPLIEELAAPQDGFLPVAAGITFSDLILQKDRNLNLFDDLEANTQLCAKVDALNARLGCDVKLASVHGLEKVAPFRISFGKLD